MYCDMIYGALNRLASQEFIDDKIKFYETPEAISFLTDLEMGINTNNCHLACCSGSLILTKSEMNSTANKVKVEFIENCKRLTACCLNQLSTNWKYEYFSDWDRGPHSYYSNFKGCIIQPKKNTTLSAIGRLYKLFPEKVYISPHFDPFINAKNKDDLDLFLRCLKNEAIKSSPSFKSINLMINAKNDTTWIWEVEKMLIPKEIISIITRLFIDSYTPILY